MARAGSDTTGHGAPPDPSGGLPQTGSGWWNVRGVVDEPTTVLPVLSPSRPRRRPPPPRTAGRAVIIYEALPRRPIWLLVFTAVMVALTIGVVLGQSVVDQPAPRSRANVVTDGAVPGAVLPSDVVTEGVLPSGGASPVPGPAGVRPTSPVSAVPLTAPLGAAKTRVLVVAGDTPRIVFRGADLGDLLYQVVPDPGGTTPQLVDTPREVRLDLARAGAEIQLSAKVRWTIRLTGPVSDLSVITDAPMPVRVRLAKGAETSTVEGNTRRPVKAGTVLTTADRSAKTGYDITAQAKVRSLTVTHP